MNISQAARQSGLSPGTIRYYEQVELTAAPQRGANGYRDYDEAAVAELCFIHRAREVGFSVEEVRQLLQIQRDPGRHSAHVKALVLEKCAEMEQRIQCLRSMQGSLRLLAGQCSGDEGPDCAILDQLARDAKRESP